MPNRVGLRFFGAFFGSSFAVPAAQAAQDLRQGQRPQAGLRGVQIVAPFVEDHTGLRFAALVAELMGGCPRPAIAG